jgi:type I restriction enzyme, S subunit
MVMDINKHDIKRFLVKSSELTRKKLFVEFYQPKFQFLFKKLHECPYPLHSLKKLSNRMFDGPFGSNRKVDMYQDSGIPYIRVKDVLPSGIFLDELKYISPEKHNELIRSRVVPGNLLITIAGRLGTAAVFPESLEEGNITGHIVGLELSKQINPHYVATFINSQLGEFQAIRLGHRTTRPELNLSEVGEFIIPVPPRPVQDRIAQIMQDAYHFYKGKIEQSQKMLADIEPFILETLGIYFEDSQSPKSFTITSEQLKTNRFDVDFYSPETNRQYQALSIQKKYKLVALGKLILQIANGSTPRGANYHSYGVPFLRIQNIRPEGINFSDLCFIDKATHEEMRRSQIKPRDLLITITGRVGTAVVVPDTLKEGNINQHIVIIRLANNTVSVDYLAEVINSTAVKFQVEHRTTGTTRIALDYQAIKSLLIPVPSFDIQQNIVKEIYVRRTECQRLNSEAENLLTEAKARVERMILGEEEVI